MPEVSDQVLEYAREQFRDYVTEWLLDDPSDMLHPDRELEPPEEFARLRLLAADLGLDFDELVSVGSDIERKRLADIESGVIKPMARRGQRRWLCTACQSRLILEEACASGVLPSLNTICDVCGAVGKFRLTP